MVITVQCPECATSFPVDPAKVPLGGVKARCSSCSAIFRVERPEDEVVPPAPAPPLLAPDDALPSAENLEADGPSAEDRSTPDVPSGEPSEPVDEGSQATVSMETPEPVAPESTDEWVFETEEDIDPDSLQIEPVGTLEESLEGAKEEISFVDSDLTPESGGEVVDTEEGSSCDADLALEGTYEDRTTAEEPEGFLASPEVAEVEGRSSFDMDFLPAVEAEMVEPDEEAVEPEPVEGILAEPVSESVPPSVPGSESEEAAPPDAEAAPAPPIAGFTFGRRDPHDKARRLARVLVSDIVTYNPERHHRALSSGSLKEDFEEEIEKSWKEYVEQVGPDIAGNTPYWSQALNDVLAKGQQIF